jgi:4-phospho-D-threonate 3-dehydrogenase / 4-phospho-D-erythronate 3-dehydrogenase
LEKNETCTGITIGDPAGIGPEVALKAVNELADENIIPLVIGRLEVLRNHYNELLDGYIIVDKIKCRNYSFSGRNKYIINVPMDMPVPIPGEGGVPTGIESKKYIDTAIELWREGIIDTLVTGPVHKGNIEKSGCHFSGHTEYIAQALNEPNPYMMMYSRDYRVLLVSTHIPLSKVAGEINVEKIVRTIRQGHEAIRAIDGEGVKLAITGLDPHCGDDGAIGSFDSLQTREAVKIARMDGIDINGPYSADTIFLPDKWRMYNLIIAHYHDQGLIPFKILAFDSGVNVTLGLSMVRTSVDHGTAFDIAGKNVAKHTSMIQAIILANLLKKGKNKV